MEAIRAVVFLVRCAENLLICDDLPSEHLQFSSMEHCRSALPSLIEDAMTPPSVVMGKCRNLLVEPGRPTVARIW